MIPNRRRIVLGQPLFGQADEGGHFQADGVHQPLALAAAQRGQRGFQPVVAAQLNGPGQVIQFGGYKRGQLVQVLVRGVAEGQGA
jgi:hypothetical protein